MSTVIPIESTDTDPPRAAGERSPLLRPHWQYVEKTSMADFRAPDWALLNRQRAEYMAEQQAAQVLDLLRASRHAPSFGYAINNYEHCLQTAALMWRDGHDEEAVVCGLLHDIGFIICPENHGRFAAELLRSYVSERNRWMLERHQIFQRIHIHDFHGEGEEFPDRHERERWRGHPHFQWTAEFVERYDIATIDSGVAGVSLADFEPLVRRVFARAPREYPLE